MSVWSRLRVAWLAWGLAKDARNVSSPQSWMVDLMSGGQAPKRGTKELLRAYGMMPRLRAVTQRIGEDVAAVAWHLYLMRETQGTVGRDAILRRGMWRERVTRRALLTRQGAVEELVEHPFLEMFAYMNPELDGRITRQVVQTHLDLKGEGYLLIDRNAVRMPTLLWPIPPHWVQSLPTKGNPVFIVRFPTFTTAVPSEDVLWLRDPDPENPYGRGTGVAQALGDELDTDEYAAQHTKTWFANRSIPPLMITAEGATDAEIIAAKALWNAQLQGVNKAHQPFWSPVKLDVKELSHTFAEQQLIQLREFERNTIIQTYGMPPELLGVIESSNRATIDASDFLYGRHLLIPRLERWRAALQHQLLPQYDDRLILDYDSPVPEDREYELRVAQAAPWSRTRNEWRTLQGLEPRQDGDEYLLPFNLIPEPAAPVVGRSVRRTMTRGPALDATALRQIAEAADPTHLTTPLDPRFKVLVDEWGAKVLTDLGLDVAFNLRNPRVQEYLRTWSSTKITDINETTRTAIRETLAEGTAAGEGVRDLAKRIEGVYDDADRRRATVIARTEVNGGANWATTDAYRHSGVVTRRTWIATRDERVRDSHADMDGEETDLANPFALVSGDNRGETADQPGDFGIAEEDINCRCTTVAVIEEPPTEAQRTILWRRYDRELRPYERSLAAGARQGFAVQREAVLAAVTALAGPEED